MWLCLPDSFLSIVHKDCGPDELLVRARRPGDIEHVFPQAKVRQDLSSDYRYRAVLKREEVAAALVAHVGWMEYPNFKNEVKDGPLHRAYAAIWGIMANLQPTRPYQGTWARRSRDLFQS